MKSKLWNVNEVAGPSELNDFICLMFFSGPTITGLSYARSTVLPFYKTSFIAWLNKLILNQILDHFVHHPARAHAPTIINMWNYHKLGSGVQHSYVVK
jgi:hypothetical protein